MSGFGGMKDINAARGQIADVVGQAMVETFNAMFGQNVSQKTIQSPTRPTNIVLACIKLNQSETEVDFCFKFDMNLLLMAAAGIFTPEATYQQGPYDERLTGATAVARMWEAERAGPAEVFRMTSEVVAVDGDTAVVRVEVWYGDPVQQEFRDLWVIRFAADGRSAAFEEWPFAPERPG